MSRALTAQSSLENLRKEAKRWLKQIRSGAPGARERLIAANPAAPAEPTLRDVQLGLARSYGYAGWSALVRALEELLLGAGTLDEAAARLLDLGCLGYGVRAGEAHYGGHYDSPLRRERAARLLRQQPELAGHSLHSAVLCGELSAARAFLARDPGAASRKAGPRGWEPLLVLAYGRLPVAAASDHALELATLLLDHGADPNAYWSYRWGEVVMKWPALCGVIGGGEAGPAALPAHARAEELARLLLRRGADPNPSQALYNTMFGPDETRWLELLIEHGLNARSPIAWSEPPAPGTLFEYLLGYAVERGQLGRARLLLRHGADPNGPAEQPHPRRALLGGHAAVAELLLSHGARGVALSGAEAFEAACMAGDAPSARRSLAEHPEYLASAGALLRRAAARGQLDAARLLLDLGVSPDDADAHGVRALHEAAASDSLAVLELLLERGADVDAIERRFGARPLGWALHEHAARATELLSRRTRCVFSLVAGGRSDELRALLAREPALARSRLGEHESLGVGHTGAEPGQTPLFVLPDDEDLALELLTLLLDAGADPAQPDARGVTAAARAEERGLEAVADALVLATERSGARIEWFRAVATGDLESAVRMLAQQPQLVAERRHRHEADPGGRWGVTALHLAAQRGHRALAELLIERGAEIEARASGNDRKGGGTPLHWAAHHDQLPIVELLVRRGANVNPDEDGGGAPGRSFDLFEHDAIGRYLIEHGARVTLFAAVRLGLFEDARALLAQEPSLIHGRQAMGFTPLHLAARKNLPRTLELLLSHGAPLDVTDELGRTPMDVAWLAGSSESHALLARAGAAPSAAALSQAPSIERAARLRRFFDACFGDTSGAERMLAEEPGLARATLPFFWPDNPVGGTALHLAAAMGNEPLIELLLRHGADVSRKDGRYGGTASGWAQEYDRRDLAERLRAIEQAEPSRSGT